LKEACVSFDLFSRHNLRRALQAIGLVRPIFRRYAWRLVLGFLALGSVNIIQLFIPRIIKHAVDGLEKGVITRQTLLYQGAAIVGLALAVAGLRFVWRYLILGFSRLLERDIRQNMFAHLLNLDRIFFQRRTTGEIMALATNDLAAVQLAAGMGLVAFADAVFMTIATIGFMAYINPSLTFIAVAPMPLLALLTSFLSARLHRRFKKVQEEFSRLTEFARTSLASIRLLKAYTLEGYQTGRFDGMGKTYVRDNLRLAAIQGTLYPISGLLANTSMLLVLYFGGRLTIGSVISLGDFVAFISYLFMLTWPTMALGWVANLFQRGVTSLDRIKAIFEAEPHLKSPVDDAMTGPPPVKEIVVRNLSFSYPDQTVPALRDVDLEIRPGVLGVVGRSGSGKTTLCHLLTRLYPLPDGTIFWDGIDVNRLALNGVRGQIAYVPQDVVLFAETLGANIAFGNPEAGKEAIERVARAAAIHDEIMAMPAGYETRIGERGVTISGGQRQRIALARALLLDRPVLIIDDGLSAVDMQTEHAIIQSLSSYLRGKICVIVSHRVAPLADAGEIVVFERGRIVARGNHDRLFADSPFYRTIYERQTNRETCEAEEGPAGEALE